MKTYTQEEVVGFALNMIQQYKQGNTAIDNRIRIRESLKAKPGLTTDELFAKAIRTWGIKSQIGQFHEEIGELMQAINKVDRLDGIGRFAILKPSHVSSVKYCRAYYNLCIEVVDAKIMLGQIESALDPEAIDISTQRRLERLEERLR